MTDATFTTATGSDIRVRFCPSPTGTPHVGLIRTALFNWAYARHTGGKLIFRIEDTDAARDSEESYEQLLDGLSWLNITWDEGEGVGGPHGPYRQSQRGDIYQGVIERLRRSGHLYESFATGEEIEARNVENGRDPKQGYDNFERDLTEDECAAYRAEGREPALRLRVPDSDLSFTDLVRGDITFPAGSFTDFVVVRPNGIPLYTFVNPVDDALMGVTHVLRGEDLLSSTPRQIALYHALIEIGLATAIPRFGHLPYVMGEGNKKLSKRDPESSLFHHRDRGFIPEGLINYLALLGWSLAPDRDVFSIDEMVAAFDVADVNPNPARFDVKKAESINGDHIRLLEVEDFADRMLPYLGDLVQTDADRTLLHRAAPLVQERMQLLGEAPGLLAFLFTRDDELEFEADALPGDGGPEVLAVASTALSRLGDWTTSAIEATLRGALIDELGLKPRVAFGPLRTAISGRRISPPLFESMELLGKESTLARIAGLAERL
ncbi:glutamyl-tRNA synthetase [Cryobacterium mesophilum]|uniref:Glutamate--tRNA ligase n=1 Tax=Terrimesophilobacter mesophilus TaxID=433647 RepID=A0A4R8V9G6_9MICO|nr:glutamate--tRNA ligase [Terrimesophilobacter mesophilus]MBB5632577.1 glutamyl-tRNA synthetase [Terrimesophilobacter mesophilus]TFB79393.1 glutamate--tRNA ligase [Terrimesophilobacter mesophilus]